MNRLIVFLAVALATGTAHANGLPFFPNTNVPDYTAKLAVRDTLDGTDYCFIGDKVDIREVIRTKHIFVDPEASWFNARFVCG
ncbi:MAG: hypothetical protein WCE42_18965 [Rhizobium ruizarguesonis]